jgi:hypothetical protein
MGQLVGAARHQSGRGDDDRRSLGEVVLRRRNEGATMIVIARELGCSEVTAWRWMKMALAARIPPTVDEFRRQQNDRLDQTQAELTLQIEAANRLVRHAAEDDAYPLMLEGLKARDRALALQLRLDERRARLNGLDAPIRVEATVEHVDPREEELAAMVREAKARMAAQETEATHDA